MPRTRISLPIQAVRSEFSDLGELEEMLARRAGDRPSGVWFERDANGAATGPGGDRFAASMFPRLLLTLQWSQTRQRRLAESFIDWWAPALLQLQHLSDAERITKNPSSGPNRGVLSMPTCAR